jgi:hypothetical protein
MTANRSVTQVLAMNTAILDQVLVPLADQFESRTKVRWYSFALDSKDYGAYQECMAELFAEGSVLTKGKGLFRLTESGYAKYIHRIRALRALK